MFRVVQNDSQRIGGMFLLPISKHCPVRLQLFMIQNQMLDNPLTARCFIYDVGCCPFFILYCLSAI